MTDTATAVLGIINRGLMPVQAVTPETRLADLDIDSLDRVDLIFAVEDELGVTIPEDALDHVTIVNDIATLVDSLRRAA